MKIFSLIVLSFCGLALSAYSQNKNCIESSFEYVNFNFSKEDLENDLLFLVGESHGVALNPKLQFQLLQYLHRNAGVRYLHLEGGYAEAYLLNHFLSTGDSAIFEFCVHTVFKEQRAMYQELYKWNNSLNEENKIEVVGFDFEHEKTKKKALELIHQKGDSIALKNVVSNVVGWNGKRDKRMAEGYLTFYKRTKGKAFGMTGSIHVKPKLSYCFRNQLDQDESPLKGKVNITLIQYHESMVNYTKPEPLEKTLAHLYDKKHIKKLIPFLAGLSYCEVSIHKMSEYKDAPGNLMGMGDYLILAKNQKAMVRWGE